MPAKEKSRDGTAPSSEQDQSLPRSYDAEQALLGSLILDGSRLNGLIEELGQPLEAQHFYARRHQAVFNGMLKCIEEHADTLDIPVLTAALEKYGLLNEAGGAAYLTQLVERASGGGSLLEYARVIIETARRRALMHAAALIREMGAHPDGRSVEELFDEASGLLMQLSEQSDGRRQGGPREMLSVLSEVFANLQTEAAQLKKVIKSRFISRFFVDLWGFL